MILFPEAENVKSDLLFMKEQLSKIDVLFDKVIKHLENCGDYDRYIAHVETLQDLLSHEDCVIDYFLNNKVNQTNNLGSALEEDKEA